MSQINVVGSVRTFSAIRSLEKRTNIQELGYI